MDSAQPRKLLGLVCGFCLHALLRLYHLLRFGIPKAAWRLTALLFNRIFYYSYLILRRLAGRRKNFTLNSQLLIGTGFINCKMPFQSGNLSGRNNTTGLDTFQPPLSLDGGPDVYWIISRYMQLSLLPCKGQMHLLHHRYLRASLLSPLQNPKTWRRKSDFISHISIHFQLQKITPTYACRFSTFVFYMGRKKFESLPGFFWMWHWTFECSYSRTILICHIHIFTTTSELASSEQKLGRQEMLNDHS